MYNSGATGADTLYAGVPVLHIPGLKVFLLPLAQLLCLPCSLPPSIPLPLSGPLTVCRRWVG
eukprot:748421-Hanusia_phi.AAC.6